MVMILTEIQNGADWIICSFLYLQMKLLHDLLATNIFIQSLYIKHI